MTEPRNFYTNKTKKGKDDKVYFNRPTYVTSGDPFKQVALQTMGRSYSKDGYLKAGHDKPFKPAKSVSVKVPRPPYEYVPLGPGPKKSYKDDDGAVMVGPRNILTNPMKQGKIGKLTTFGGMIQHLPDDYDAKKKLTAKEREYHLSKIQEKPFSQRAKHTETFNKPKEVYAEDPPIPPKKVKQPEPLPELHDKPFKPANPSKKGYKATLNKFPEYVPNPPAEKKRVKKVDGEEEERPGFKATYKGLTRPTPSVALNIRNLKSSYPAAFRR